MRNIIILLAALLASTPMAATHEHGNPMPSNARTAARAELGLTAAFDGDGRLWIASKAAGEGGDHVVLRHSEDEGRSWSGPITVNARAEAVSADGENRPKLAFGPRGALYVAWTHPTSARFTGDVRLARSEDGGRTWSAPVNVHRDAQRITHRFESMIVDGEGTLWVAWIDKRDAGRGDPAEGGAAVYTARSADGGRHWEGDRKLAPSSCECCRIALALDRDGRPLALWRHVFPGSERDHALARLDDPEPRAYRRATFDRWSVEACPHHGPGLAVAPDGTLHSVWFDQVAGESRVFYGRLVAGQARDGTRDRVDGQRALPDARAEHADIVVAGERVWVAWKSFDGERLYVRTEFSDDGGRRWQPGPALATAGAADQPRLAVRAGRAWLVWNTARDGVVVKGLP